MNVTVNSDIREIGDGKTIADLLQVMPAGREPKGMAVAVNNEVVPGKDWDAFRLKDGDRVLIIRAAQGG